MPQKLIAGDVRVDRALCGQKRILTFDQALRYPEVSIKDQFGNVKTCSYSWSTDGVCWSGWVDYPSYRRLTKDLESDFFLRVLLSGIIGSVEVDGRVTKCYSLSWAPMDLTGDVCSSTTFSPYANLDCALLLQQQMSDRIICVLGIPVFYFRVSPEEGSEDFSFKEFKLHNVVDVKQIKLMVEDGQMPSSNPKITDLDFDWDIDWETEVSKTQFAAAFGDQVIPKQRDIIYIPMMKRVWQVNSAYDEKQDGLLWRSTTWKLALMKYQDSTNVDKNIFDGVLDNFIGKTWDNTFADLEENEQERETAYTQLRSPRHASNNLYDLSMEDSIRTAYTDSDIQILDKFYCHHNNVVARNIYRPRSTDAEVIYKEGLCGDEGMITMIIETPGTSPDITQIGSFGPIKFSFGSGGGRDFIFGVEDLHAVLEPFSTYMILYKWSHALVTKELYIYKQCRRMDMPLYMIRPEGYWFDLDNPVLEKVGEYNNDYTVSSPAECSITPYPLHITNIKYYNKFLLQEDALPEIVRYTTDHKSCVFSDLARPITSGIGYSVK